MSIAAKLEKIFDAANNLSDDRGFFQDYRVARAPSKVPHWKRVRNAAILCGNESEWNKIEDCNVGSYCHSFYCRDCRTRGVKSHTNRILSLHHQLHNNDSEGHHNLRFATVLCDLVPLDVNMISASIAQANKHLKAIRRKFPGLGTHGRFELEAVDMRMVRSGICPRKKHVAGYLNKDDDASIDDDRVLVHFHMILFLNGNNSKQVLSLFNDRWPGTYRVRIDRFHMDKPIEQSISRLCDYMLKSRVTYNYSMNTIGHTNNRYIKDSTLSFLVTMSNTYDDRSLLIYSKDTL